MCPLGGLGRRGGSWAVDGNVTAAAVATPSDTLTSVNDFVIRTWHLAHYPGDQAPPHVHYQSDEAFVVLRGRLEVLLGSERRILETGENLTVPARVVHTFATVDPDGVDVVAVMTPEVDQLITALHTALTNEERADVWGRYNSEVLPPRDPSPEPNH